MAVFDAIATLVPEVAPQLSLKWPNDLLVRGRKACGILIELRAEAQGPGHVVIGTGLNLRLAAKSVRAIEALGTEPGDLQAAGLDVADRNRIAAALVAHYAQGVAIFGRDGFAPFAADWARHDALRDRDVRVMGVDVERAGKARGIDAQGNLVLELAGGRRETVVSGDVSVRAGTP